MVETVEKNQVNVRVIVENANSNGLENRVGIDMLEQELASRGLADLVEVRFFDGRVHGRLGVAERPAVPGKPGNAGGGKGPQFKINARRGKGRGDWATYQLRLVFRNCRRRYIPKRSPKPGYRFYALYDKIYREDILAHAYAQCRSNKGAPGVDGQDFAEVEAYGAQRWLGELAQALREESYRPEAVRRVYIPKPNGKLRPLGIPTVNA